MFSCSSTICWNDQLFFVELIWHLCWKLFGHIDMNLFLESVMCSADLHVYPFSNTALSWFLKLRVTLQIKECKSSDFVHIFQINFLAILTFFVWFFFLHKIRAGLTIFILKKPQADIFDWNCVESIDQLREHWQLNNIESSNS